MARFVTLHHTDDDITAEVLVNIDHVLAVLPRTDGCRLVFGSHAVTSNVLDVVEGFDQARSRLYAAASRAQSVEVAT